MFKKIMVGMFIFCMANFATYAQDLLIHSFPSHFCTENQYVVTINGKPAKVFHAGMKIYFVSFDLPEGKTAQINVLRPFKAGNYWNSSAQIRPFSKNISVAAEGNKVSFSIDKCGQYILQKKGASSAFNEEAFLVFANPVEKKSVSKSDKNVIWLDAGLHYGYINLKSNQTLYLDSGAVLFGAINVFDAENVSILGRGTVVYTGAQSLERDDAFQSQQNWHPLTTRYAKNLKVEGVTFVNRARTWTIQMYKTFDTNFDNFKVVVVSHENVNGDGMDWYDGGNSVVKNSFIRCADDCFAFFAPDAGLGMYKNGVNAPGAVKNIEIENCVLWPTLANVFRIGFQLQDLVTDSISIKNSDVINVGNGFWHAPWSLFCAITPCGKGSSRNSNYLVENVRFESPVVLFGLENPRAEYENFTIKNVKISGKPAESMMRGKIKNFVFDNVVIDGKVTPLSELNLEKGSIPQK